MEGTINTQKGSIKKQNSINNDKEKINRHIVTIDCYLIEEKYRQAYVSRTNQNSHNFEPYLRIENFEHRRAITKIRTSSHKLEIETGRWHNIQRTDRTCKNCALDIVEDELHFLLDCTMHVIERKNACTR